MPKPKWLRQWIPTFYSGIRNTPKLRKVFQEGGLKVLHTSVTLYPHSFAFNLWLGFLVPNFITEIESMNFWSISIGQAVHESWLRWIFKIWMLDIDIGLWFFMSATFIFKSERKIENWFWFIWFEFLIQESKVGTASFWILKHEKFKSETIMDTWVMYKSSVLNINLLSCFPPKNELFNIVWAN